jgi:hypothetical protein
MRKALRHQEPDRVPIIDFFWGGFLRRWRSELGLPDDASPYYHYDLDWIATVPNMDPWMRPFETLKETPDEVVVKTSWAIQMILLVLFSNRLAVFCHEWKGCRAGTRWAIAVALAILVAAILLLTYGNFLAGRG